MDPLTGKRDLTERLDRFNPSAGDTAPTLVMKRALWVMRKQLGAVYGNTKGLEESLDHARSEAAELERDIPLLEEEIDRISQSSQRQG